MTPRFDDMADALSRRRFLAGLGSAAAVAAFLAACGDDGDEAPAASTSTPAATPTGTVAAAATPTATPEPTEREFVDSRGETVVVPARPQRVVALHDSNAGVQVLSLGVPLVGLAHFWEWDSPPPLVTRHFDLEGVEGIGWWLEVDVEKIASLQPDLILAYAGDDGSIFPPLETYDRLEAIAPVVAINPFRPVEEVMAAYAELLGADEATLSAQQADLDRALGEVEAALDGPWSEVTVAYMHARTDSVDAWGPRRLPVCDILTRVGAAWFPLGLEADTQPAGVLSQLSLERIQEFACDLLLYSNNRADHSGNPLFEALGAVQSGQVIPMPEPFFGTTYLNYIAAAEFIAERVKAMQPFDSGIV